jgi:hypothetical protein
VRVLSRRLTRGRQQAFAGLEDTGRLGSVIAIERVELPLMSLNGTAPSAPPKEAANARDRFTIWPFALAWVFPILLALLWSGPMALTWGVPVLLSIWALAALFSLCLATFLVTVRAWRRAASLLVLPLATVAAIVKANALWLFAIDTGEHIHFRVMRGDYLSQVAKLPADAGPRIAVFNWGGFVISHAVVYDESDQVLLPAEKQSPSWKKKIAGTELDCGVWGDPMGDHFYIVRIGC